MKKITLLILVLGLKSYGQDIHSLSLSAWKNGAKGAYSIIHDDFGMEPAKGIGQHVDSVATSMNISVSFAVVTSHCDAMDWKKANEMIAHGHEILNHSHNHFCGLPVSWCPNDYYHRTDYEIEYNLSTSIIKKETGIQPEFFVFPYDLINDTMLTYLKDSLHMLGARSGEKDAFNRSDSIKNFGLNFHILRPEDNHLVLDNLVLNAIETGTWAIRGCHGVQDASWGSILLKDYVSHLKLLQKKVATNELWVTTPVRVLKYNRCKKKTKLFLHENKILVVNGTKYNQSELTLQLDVSEKYDFIQNGKSLKCRYSKGVVFVNFIPQRGNIKIRKTGGQ